MADSLETIVLHAARTRLFKDYLAQILECLRVLGEDQIWQRPGEHGNAVGSLVLHVCGSTRHYVVDAIGGEPSERNRAAEFAPESRISKPELIDHLRTVFAEAERILEALAPDRLLVVTDRTGKPTPLVRILLHQLGHVAFHTGQIVYATKALTGVSLDELWMRVRQPGPTPDASR